MGDDGFPLGKGRPGCGGYAARLLVWDMRLILGARQHLPNDHTHTINHTSNHTHTDHSQTHTTHNHSTVTISHTNTSTHARRGRAGPNNYAAQHHKAASAKAAACNECGTRARSQIRVGGSETRRRVVTHRRVHCLHHGEDPAKRAPESCRHRMLARTLARTTHT